MSPIESLLTVVDAYREATGLAEATVSTRFLARGSQLKDLREGADIGSRRVERVLAEMSAQWPAGAAWPEGVVRPSPTGMM